MGKFQRLVTSGTSDLDGGSWEVDNNIWTARTHGHNDHVTVAAQLSETLGAG